MQGADNIFSVRTMEAAKNIFIFNIIFALLQCVSYMHADCYSSEYKILAGGYNIYMANGIQPVYNTVRLTNKSECSQMCATENFCNVWRYGGGDCQIFHSLKDNVTAIISSNATTYYEAIEDSQWIQIYSVESGSGISVASTFLGNGDYKSWGLMSCLQTYCLDFFRSSLINAWSSLPIHEVRLSLFTNGTETLYVIFNGTGTNSQNWFSMSHVVYSPWNDVYAGATHAFFGINFLSQRSFYASKHDNACVNDSGWIAVTEPHMGCNWDWQPFYPSILYSYKNNATEWETEYGSADALAVYITF